MKHTFFSFHRASRPTPDTFTTLKRTPGISPFALPRRPKPEMSTSSFSSTKFKQPSFWSRAADQSDEPRRKKEDEDDVRGRRP